MAAPLKKPNATAAKEPKNTGVFVFKKENYFLLLLSLLVIIIGFVIMGGSDDKPFDDPMKISVAPVIVLLGFIIGVFSILYTPKSNNKDIQA